MNIHEHQAKEVLKGFGAPVAKGVAITSLDQAETAVGALSDFNGQQVAGSWTLTINDNAAFFDGTLQSWSLEFCFNENTIPEGHLFSNGFEPGDPDDWSYMTTP